MTSALAQLQSRVFSADEVLSPYIYVFYAAFIVSFLFTPIMRAVAIYYGIVDQPDRVRKMHLTPVAYLGGVAIFLGVLAAAMPARTMTPPAAAGSPGSLRHPQVRPGGNNALALQCFNNSVP